MSRLASCWGWAWVSCRMCFHGCNRCCRVVLGDLFDSYMHRSSTSFVTLRGVDLIIRIGMLSSCLLVTLTSHPDAYTLWNGDLKFNICGIETSYYRNKDIEGVQERIEQVITPALMYASRYWADHLESGSVSEADLHPFVGRVRDFFTRRFLYWIEVFSLKEQMSMIPVILRKVTNWAKVCHCPDA